MGPNGTLWAQTGLSNSLAVTRIEFGNEVLKRRSVPRRWLTTAAGIRLRPYRQIAVGYGAAYVSAVQAVAAADPSVRVLAVADSPGNVPQWLQGHVLPAPRTSAAMSRGGCCIPTVISGRPRSTPRWPPRPAWGASNSIPVFITEFGVATDNGNCLNNNYGYNTCMTYGQAAAAVATQIAGMEADLGSRLQELDVYSTSDLSQPGATSDSESYFGALQVLGATKGAYTSEVEDFLGTTSS